MANTLYVAVYTSGATATWARGDLGNGRNGWSASGYVASIVDGTIRSDDGDDLGIVSTSPRVARTVVRVDLSVDATGAIPSHLAKLGANLTRRVSLARLLLQQSAKLLDAEGGSISPLLPGLLRRLGVLFDVLVKLLELNIVIELLDLSLSLCCLLACCHLGISYVGLG